MHFPWRWYAKRFLHPDIVAPYEYIFIWDEDLGVEHFDSEKYVFEAFDFLIMAISKLWKFSFFWQISGGGEETWFGNLTAWFRAVWRAHLGDDKEKRRHWSAQVRIIQMICTDQSCSTPCAYSIPPLIFSCRHAEERNGWCSDPNLPPCAAYATLPFHRWSNASRLICI